VSDYSNPKIRERQLTTQCIVTIRLHLFLIVLNVFKRRLLPAFFWISRRLRFALFERDLALEEMM